MPELVREKPWWVITLRAILCLPVAALVLVVVEYLGYWMIYDNFVKESLLEILDRFPATQNWTRVGVHFLSVLLAGLLSIYLAAKVAASGRITVSIMLASLYLLFVVMGGISWATGDEAALSLELYIALLLGAIGGVLWVLYDEAESREKRARCWRCTKSLTNVAAYELTDGNYVCRACAEEEYGLRPEGEPSDSL